jgi:hypothetical protein
VARQQHLAEAALADHLEEVEVAGLGGGVRGRAQVDLLGRAGLKGGGRKEKERRGNRSEPSIRSRSHHPECARRCKQKADSVAILRCTSLFVHHRGRRLRLMSCTDRYGSTQGGGAVLLKGSVHANQRGQMFNSSRVTVVYSPEGRGWRS